jgi:site-specific recombinase XerD
VFAKFEEFLGSKNATFYDIDEKVLLDFQNHLRTKYENKVNTIQGNMKIIRRIFSIAIERSIITSNDDPFKNVKIRQEKSIRDFLTEDEVIRLSKLDLEEGSYLERVRDVFIWTIFSGGLRISDVLLLRKSNFEANVLTLIIQKTKTPHRVTLPENAYKVLVKYLEQIKGADGFAFGLLEERFNGVSPIQLDKAVTGATQKYNKALKVLATMAEISKTIGSHQARISFVTIAAQNGVPLTTIQGMVCHSKIDMTALYSKYVDNQGDEALKMLEKKIIQ